MTLASDSRQRLPIPNYCRLVSDPEVLFLALGGSERGRVYVAHHNACLVMVRGDADGAEWSVEWASGSSVATVTGAPCCLTLAAQEAIAYAGRLDLSVDGPSTLT